MAWLGFISLANNLFVPSDFLLLRRQPSPSNPYMIPTVTELSNFYFYSGHPKNFINCRLCKT